MRRFECQSCGEVTMLLTISEEQHCPACGAVQASGSDSDSKEAGMVFKDYVIDGVCAEGRTTIVYKAHQMNSKAQVALKVLKDDVAKSNENLQQFIKASRTAAQFQHPNIIRTFAAGEDNGRYFVAHEYFDGQSLLQFLVEQGNTLQWEFAIRLIIQIAEALTAIWKSHKFIHRDLREEVIMVNKRGVAKIISFKLAVKAASSQDSGSNAARQTRYPSPQMQLGLPLDCRSDIFSLGALFYRMLSGAAPKKIPDDIPGLRPEINAVIQGMLERDLKLRYQDYDELLQDLVSLSRGNKPGIME